MEPFQIGSTNWPGLGKAVEELGEALQVFGKIVGAGGAATHFDGSDLEQRIEEELADMIAAAQFVAQANGLDVEGIEARAAAKIRLFWGWHLAALKEVEHGSGV